MRTLLAIIASVALLGCSRHGDHFLILLGESSTPPYDSLIVGKIYPRITASGTDRKGEIVVTSNGVELTRFTRGGMAFASRGGVLEFKGKLEKDCLLYVVRGVPGSHTTLLYKKLLSTNAPMDLSIDLDLLEVE